MIVLQHRGAGFAHLQNGQKCGNDLTSALISFKQVLQPLHTPQQQLSKQL